MPVRYSFEIGEQYKGPGLRFFVSVDQQFLAMGGTNGSVVLQEKVLGSYVDREGISFDPLSRGGSYVLDIDRFGPYAELQNILNGTVLTKIYSVAFFSETAVLIGRTPDFNVINLKDPGRIEQDWTIDYAADFGSGYDPLAPADPNGAAPLAGATAIKFVVTPIEDFPEIAMVKLNETTHELQAIVIKAEAPYEYEFLGDPNNSYFYVLGYDSERKVLSQSYKYS